MNHFFDNLSVSSVYILIQICSIEEQAFRIKIVFCSHNDKSVEMDKRAVRK